MQTVANPVDLASWPSLGLGSGRGEQSWTLHGPDGTQSAIVHTPRFVTADMMTLLTAAVAGVGVVQLPLLMVRRQLQRGELVRLLPDLAPRPEIIHAVYPSRRGSCRRFAPCWIICHKNLRPLKKSEFHRHVGQVSGNLAFLRPPRWGQHFGLPYSGDPVTISGFM
jgi:LysR substrate binding domain